MHVCVVSVSYIHNDFPVNLDPYVLNIMMLYVCMYIHRFSVNMT